MADRKKCSTFGVWLQTDLDSAAQNLMETIIKVYIYISKQGSATKCLDQQARDSSSQVFSIFDAGSERRTAMKWTADT